MDDKYFNLLCYFILLSDENHVYVENKGEEMLNILEKMESKL